MPERKPIPPAVQEMLRVGIGVVARSAAAAVDSFLKDASQFFRAGDRKVTRARENIQNKVQQSDVDYEPPDHRH
jgi:hypothetical protein